MTPCFLFKAEKVDMMKLHGGEHQIETKLREGVRRVDCKPASQHEKTACLFLTVSGSKDQNVMTAKSHVHSKLIMLLL